jgi:hypothetical protein
VPCIDPQPLLAGNRRYPRVGDHDVEAPELCDALLQHRVDSLGPGGGRAAGRFRPSPTARGRLVARKPSGAGGPRPRRRGLARTAAVVFRELILAFTRVFTGSSDHSIVGRAPNPHVPELGMWFVVVVPVIGGLVYGPLVDRFVREARGHGVPEVMLAVAEKGGRIAPQVAVVKSLASALCIGSGGSVGREGPIVQIGSALGSTVGQTIRVPESRLHQPDGGAERRRGHATCDRHHRNQHPSQ